MKENKEIRSGAHFKYRCQYHIVFAPKYQRKEIYGKLRKDIGEIISEYIRDQLEEDYALD